MDGAGIEVLTSVGKALDADIYPYVYNGGIVAPSNHVVASKNMGAEKKHGQQGKTRTQTGSRQEAQIGRFWEARGAPQVFNERLRQAYCAQLGAVLTAYPGTLSWQQKEGLWLSVESSVLAELDRRATFLVALPFVATASVKAWGFWTTPISSNWIGPRHTNYPEGSICAYEPRDQTWSPGDSVVTLLDLYTLWALRHLHLEVIGRWPGRQSVLYAFERLKELQDDELCGCEQFGRKYVDCCKKSDLAADRATSAAEFLRDHPNFGIRTPPERILRFLRERNNPPSFLERLG